MADKKPRKIFRIMGFALLVVVVIVGVLSGLDYKSYKDGSRSHLFGTLDSFRQNQTLKFGNLDLKVTNVDMKPYLQPTPPAQSDCSGLFETRSLLLGGDPYFVCQSGLTHYQNEITQYRNKNSLTVGFAYSNIGNKPLNLANYKVNLIANTGLGSDSTCSNFPNSRLLKGTTETGCLTAAVNKTYHGPLTLSVISNGKEKDISLTLPASPH